jgi:type IV secretion system protein TrbL
MKTVHKSVLIGATLALFSSVASAQLSNQGMLDTVATAFATHASFWQTAIMNAALFLFWTLGTISMVWTFGMMAFRQADLGEFFAEFIKFIATFGLFLWLLRNGPAFANSIIQSMARLAEQASGVASITPSGIVDVGFLIWKQAIRNLSVWSPIDSTVGVLLSAGIMVLLALVAINMLLMLVSAWLLAYAGIFFLGFGGSRWTSDIAINYYKTVLGMGAQIMTMVLLVGIGNDLLSTYYAKMNMGTLNFEELGVMLVFCLALLVLVNRVPQLVAGVISGGSVGSAAGIGSFGAGSVLGAASVAAGAAGMAGAAMAHGAANVAGGTQALMAAFSSASENVSSDKDVMAAFAGGSGMGNDFGEALRGGAGDSGSTPFAEAAGFGSSNSGNTRSRSDGGGVDTDNGAGHAAKAQPNAPKTTGAGAPSQQGPSMLSSAASALGMASRVAVDAGATLARGSASVAKEKAGEIRDAAMARISETAGGRVAAAIRESSATAPPEFGGDSLAGSDAAALNGEVAAFVDRQTPA